MTKAKKQFQPLTSNAVFLIYESLVERNLVSFSAHQSAKNKVEAIISSINGSYFGQELYPTIEEKLVAYFYFIIKNHPFTDGNKRTASLAFSVACGLNDKTLKSKYILDELAVFMESIQDPDHQSVIKIMAKDIFN